ncbi:PREDICTED: uncharacterized protein LOC101313676 isoform X2 [Fragaria vesca subsp. vesca]|uniref:uncharacterized protein LOC101313676 isoform X2 n=1 Tax=Fragaria vesca subsp. vesca TaxID=101020 RepID=UPI0002C2DD35|nr:PREDICTED: uncharacterized protein LOC101313676 isoform X2 [Fragaria vesca subsp. vesca]
MYPKVRVRVHQQENHILSQNDHRRVPETKVSDESPSIPVKEIQGCSLPLKPKIMKASVPKVPAGLGQSLSSSKDKSRHLGKQDAKPDVRACSSVPLRPRAVLSSPDNDGMIGLVNKLFDKTPSAVKVHKERVLASQRQQRKASPSPMSMTKGSNRAVSTKTGLVQSKLQKNMKGKQQQASARIGKSSFTT